MAQTMPIKQILTVADTIVQQLAAFGVKRIYGVAGDTFLDLLDAINRSQEISFIAVKHETTAAFMASAEAKLTGGLGVCVATSGPGMANLLNGLGDAHQDKAAVLAITGQVPTKQIGTDAEQYLDQQVFIAPLAAYSALLAHPDATVDVFSKAIHVALQQGAVTHVSVPKDIFTQMQNRPIRTKPSLVQGTQPVSDADIAQVVQLMQSAERPMVVAGRGAQAAAPALQSLCEAWGAGLILSLGGKGMIPETFPQLVGGLGKAGSPQAAELLQKADVVLLAGSTWWPEGYVPEQAKIIQVDRSALQVGTRFAVEVGVVGTTQTILPQLAERMQGYAVKQQWLDEVTEARNRWVAQVEQEAGQEGAPVHPARLMRALQNTVASDAIFCVDTGDHTVWFNRIFQAEKQQALFSGSWRSMGFGLPAAMACQLAQPDKQVVALVGDGCLGMTLADLSTAVRYQMPLTIVVVNNGFLQMETDRQIVGEHARIGSDLTNPDFARVAEACGMTGMKVTNSQELDKTLEQALSLPGPVLVDVATADVLFPNTAPKEG